MSNNQNHSHWEHFPSGCCSFETQPLMNEERLETAIRERFEKCMATLRLKGAEYATGDRFHNFRVAGRIQNCTTEKALWGIFIKHLVSLMDIVDSTQSGQYPTDKFWDEKIGDSINYLLLLDGLIQERAGK